MTTFKRQAFLSLAVSVLCLAIQGAAPAFAEKDSGGQWIERELQDGKYSLSEDERDAVPRCSIYRQNVVEVAFEPKFVTIIFDAWAPIFFRQSEISSDLLQKLRAMKVPGSYSVLCVHSFYRDDWQKQYDLYGAVNHKLLNIVPSAGKFPPELAKGKVPAAAPSAFPDDKGEKGRTLTVK